MTTHTPSLEFYSFIVIYLDRNARDDDDDDDDDEGSSELRESNIRNTSSSHRVLIKSAQ